eukprot:gene8326-3120_t
MPIVPLSGQPDRAPCLYAVGVPDGEPVPPLQPAPHYATALRVAAGL